MNLYVNCHLQIGSGVDEDNERDDNDSEDEEDESEEEEEQDEEELTEDRQNQRSKFFEAHWSLSVVVVLNWLPHLND